MNVYPKARAHTHSLQTTDNTIRATAAWKRKHFVAIGWNRNKKTVCASWVNAYFFVDVIWCWKKEKNKTTHQITMDSSSKRKQKRLKLFCNDEIVAEKMWWAMQDELIFCLSMIALLCYCTQYTNTYKYMWHDMMSVPKETHVLNTYVYCFFSSHSCVGLVHIESWKPIRVSIHQPNGYSCGGMEWHHL